jgi:hypothetical protein
MRPGGPTIEPADDDGAAGTREPQGRPPGSDAGAIHLGARAFARSRKDPHLAMVGRSEMSARKVRKDLHMLFLLLPLFKESPLERVTHDRLPGRFS